jgi:ABC-2 type transport system permease protein/lipopolysaccharide transport system permease protein
MLHEQWEFRELLTQMTLRDLVVRYKQSIMGFGWAVFMPLMNTLIFSVVFTRVATVETAVPYPVFAYTGLLFWNYFGSSLRFAASSLASNATLVSKIYFPREIFPFSSILVCLVDLAVGASVLVVLMVYYRVPVTPAILFLPVLLLIQTLLTAGIGLLLAMANLFLRDVKYLLEMVLSLWMFATSVVYPMDQIGGKLGMIVKLNPMNPIIEGFRSVILLGQLPPAAPLLVAAALALASLAAGWLVFHRAEYRFAEFA